ncbi:peptidase M50 [Desulfurococcus mucosus DSM 2162]|uniref:Peptidase M50 n=2 Tax=Desulfurococcus mucosus TaxID=2275 RepID=E8R7B5_DESM0|nr:peptidase M50 [Desulfurococcus mucosus DSM 2162]
MDAIYVFAVLLAVFWILVNLFYRRLRLAESGVVELHSYVILVFKKGVGWAPRPSRRIRVYNAASTLLYFLSLALFTYSALASVLGRLRTGSSGVVVLVPGVNIVGVDLLFFLASVSIAASLHEYLHAVFALRNGVPVKSYGVMLLLILPLAYVEVDEEAFRKAGRGGRIGVLSAGVAVNLALAFASMLLLSAMSSPIGVLVTGVEEGSPAYEHGVQVYDVIVSVNGTPVRGIGDIPVVRKLAKPTVLEVAVWRSGSGIVNLTIPIGVGDERIGVYLSPAPSTWLISSLGASAALAAYRFTMWMWIVNFSLALLNAAPLFVTDGGRVIGELAGEKWGRVINAASLLLFIAMILP